MLITSLHFDCAIGLKRGVLTPLHTFCSLCCYFCVSDALTVQKRTKPLAACRMKLEIGILLWPNIS